MHLRKTTLIATACAILAGCHTPQKSGDLIETAVAEAEATHNIQAWWGKDLVRAELAIHAGDQTVVDGTFTFEANGPRARFDRKDGASVIFDGSTAWITPADAEPNMARFHVLTWPWFIYAPFKMQGEQSSLSDYAVKELEGQSYLTFKQTFAAGTGDAPDDWYRLYLDPDTKRLEAMAYIVTYGKSVDKAEESPSIIHYQDYVDAGGPLVSTRYEFWYLDPETGQHKGGSAKLNGTIRALDYLAAGDTIFEVPADAKELELPES